MTQPTDPETKIRAAFDDLRVSADALPHAEALATVTGARRRAPRWIFPVGGLAVASCALAFVMISRSGDGDTQLDITYPPSTTTSAAPDTDPIPLTVADDGYYPWIFPAPIDSNFDEGCSGAADTARTYLVARGDSSAQLTLVDETADGTRYEVAARHTNDQIADQTTIVTVAPIDVGFAACQAWGVVSAQSPGSVTLDSVGSDDNVGGTFDIAGTATAGGGVTITAADESGPIGVEATMEFAAGENGEFATSLALSRAPTDANLTLTATSAGHLLVPPFAEVKVRFDGSPIDPPPPPDPVRPALDPFNFDYPVGAAQTNVRGKAYPVRNGSYRGPSPTRPGETADVTVADAQIGDWDHDGDADALVILREGTLTTTGKFVSLRMLSDVGPDMHQTGEAFVADRPVISEFAPVTIRLGTDVRTSVSLVWRSTIMATGWFEGGSAVGADGTLSTITPMALDPTAQLYLDGSEVPIATASDASLIRWAGAFEFDATRPSPKNSFGRLHIDADGQSLLTVSLWPDGIPEAMCSTNPRVTDSHGLRPTMPKSVAEELVGPINTSNDTQFTGRNEEFMTYRWSGTVLTEICRGAERF